MEGKAIKCSRAFLKQEATKVPLNQPEPQKITRSQKTTDESKESPDSSFDIGLDQKKKANLAGGSKLKPKIKGIRVADAQSQTGDLKDRCENNSSTANPSPILPQFPRDPWSVDSPGHHKNSLESCGLSVNPPPMSDRAGSRLSHTAVPNCDSFQRVNMYPDGSYPVPYGQCWPAPAGFSFHPAQANHQYPREAYYDHQIPEQTPYQSSARTGGAIGQRFRGFSEHETTASGPSYQWTAFGRNMPTAVHHQGYSSSDWPFCGRQEDSRIATPGCTPAAGTQRKAGPAKPSTYRMF